MKDKKPAGQSKVKKLTTRKLNAARETIRDLSARSPEKIRGGQKPMNGTS